MGCEIWHTSDLLRCHGPTCSGHDWQWFCPECGDVCERCRASSEKSANDKEAPPRAARGEAKSMGQSVTVKVYWKISVTLHQLLSPLEEGEMVDGGLF